MYFDFEVGFGGSTAGANKLNQTSEINNLNEKFKKNIFVTMCPESKEYNIPYKNKSKFGSLFADTSEKKKTLGVGPVDSMCQYSYEVGDEEGLGRSCDALLHLLFAKVPGETENHWF